MKRIYILLFALSLLVALTTSCKKDPYINVIPNEVLGEVNSFIIEGNARGVNVELGGLKIVLLNYAPNGNAGEYHHTTHTIYLDTTSNSYKFSPETKEFLIFHELGHAVLKRPHLDDLTPNNLYQKSIMHTTLTAQWSPPLQSHRAYYLDEIFNPNTPTPAWGI